MAISGDECSILEISLGEASHQIVGMLLDQPSPPYTFAYHDRQVRLSTLDECSLSLVSLFVHLSEDGEEFLKLSIDTPI